MTWMFVCQAYTNSDEKNKETENNRQEGNEDEYCTSTIRRRSVITTRAPFSSKPSTAYCEHFRVIRERGCGEVGTFDANPV